MLRTGRRRNPAGPRQSPRQLIKLLRLITRPRPYVLNFAAIADLRGAFDDGVRPNTDVRAEHGVRVNDGGGMNHGGKGKARSMHAPRRACQLALCYASRGPGKWRGPKLYPAVREAGTCDKNGHDFPTLNARPSARALVRRSFSSLVLSGCCWARFFVSAISSARLKSCRPPPAPVSRGGASLSSGV